MSKVFFSVGITLDGFIAGPNGGPKNPLGDKGTTIHNWMFATKAFQDTHDFEGEGQTGPDNDVVAAIISRIGANIMGKRMFDEGEFNWPENAPFHTPVYVHTHEKREPWERKGGTTFYFTSEGIHTVLEKAKQAAGGKDVRISGGADTIMQYLNAGLVDEFSLHVAPMMMGKGTRLFENVDNNKFSLQVDKVISSPNVTHLYYKVINN